MDPSQATTSFKDTSFFWSAISASVECDTSIFDHLFSDCLNSKKVPAVRAERLFSSG